MKPVVPKVLSGGVAAQRERMMPPNREERWQAIRAAVGYVQRSTRDMAALEKLFSGGIREAGVSPSWYAELAGELAGAGALDGPAFPSPRLERIARLVGYYLWLALAATESDRGNENGCRRVLARVARDFGQSRIENFDFDRLQPRKTDPIPPFDLTVLRKVLADYTSAGRGLLQEMRDLVRAGKVAQAAQRMKDWPQAKYGKLPSCDLAAVFNGLVADQAVPALMDFVTWRHGNGYPLTAWDWKMLLEVVRHGADADQLARAARLAEEEVEAPDAPLVQELLCAYDQLEQPDKAIQAFQAAQAQNLPLDAFHYTTMIGVAARKGDSEAAQRYFHLARQAAPDDVRPWSSLIQGYAQMGQPEHAREVFEHMRQEGVVPDSDHYAAVLKAYVQAEQLEQARKLFDRMREAGVAPGVYHFNLMIKAYSQAGQPSQARDLFDQMQDSGIQPDVYTWNSLINAYGQAGWARQAQELFDQMPQTGVTPNIHHYGALINAYAQAGLARQAQEVFDRLPAAGFMPNAYHYGALINAYAQAGLARQAQEVFNRMPAAGISPNIHHYGALINAHSQAERPEEAETILKACLATLELSPVDRTFLYNLVIKAYSKLDRLADATRLKDEMLLQGVPIDRFTLGSINNSSVRTGLLQDERLAVRAREAEQWKELATLFEDVIHELNQLVGRIGLSRRTLDNYLQRGDLPQACAASDRLREVVAELGDRVLVYQGLTRGRNAVETFRVSETTEEVRRLLQVQAEHASVRIDVQINDVNQWERPLYVRGDPFLFRLALRNLVSNGIQALGESAVPPGERRVRIDGLYSPPSAAGEAPDGWVDLRVWNNGPPIAPDVRRKIFDRGFSTKRGRGLGLGLSLVQSVAEAHSGRIILNDAVQQGVEFWLRVPAALPNL
jgi:pentatricopeptide repeat protein